ncbi:MAG: hypothetical protein R3C99_12970 [Pirellulaceae bacterium]
MERASSSDEIETLVEVGRVELLAGFGTERSTTAGAAAGIEARLPDGWP